MISTSFVTKRHTLLTSGLQIELDANLIQFVLLTQFGK